MTAVYPTGLRFEDLGEMALKNMPEKIRVFRLGRDGEEPLSRHRPSEMPVAKLMEKPSIAVLPFANLSSDREQEFFADGMTEDIITALSRVRELFVISRNSSAVYKGRPVRIEDVARKLGVRFVLEGSIRVAGSRVRVTAQLIDGISGNHVWAERFDGTLDDIFGMQDQITREIVLALQVKLTYGELARLWEGQTKNLRAWEKMALARDLFLKFNPIDNREAKRALQEALAIDPAYTGAMALLGLCHWWDARFNLGTDKERSLQLAEEQVENVLRINPDMGSAYMLRGGIAFLRDRHEEAIGLCEKAVELAPSDSWTTAFLGLVCVFAGEEEKALAALKTALRLSPHYPTWYIFNFALAKLGIGDLDGARAAAEEYRAREPNDPHAFLLMVILNGFEGKAEEAARAASELREAFPEFSIRDVLIAFRYKDRRKLDAQLAALRIAGIPE
jgi:TolB-like protein/tetratricopeptide (TPR) repeat protein